MPTSNFLLGYGERLTERIKPPQSGGPKAHPYTFEQAKTRLVPRLKATAQKIQELSPSVCPNDQAVAVMTLHPTYLAKSYYPEELLTEIGVYPVGSRTRSITPERWGREKHPDSAVTAELYVAGPRSKFLRWANSLDSWSNDSRGSKDIKTLEDFAPFMESQKIRPILTEDPFPLLEIVLHASASSQSSFILQGFQEYMRILNIQIDLDKRIHAGGLCFLPVRVPREQIGDVAKFSFLRVARQMPELRTIPIGLRSLPNRQFFTCNFPEKDALDPNIRVAVFDGGLPENLPIERWVKRGQEARNMIETHPDFISHGLAVTSALLFGSLEEGKEVPVPFAKVDHFRILDKDTNRDPQDELFDVLNRITQVLQTHDYDFVNLSLGPNLPIEDDDVHVWTAVLDQLLSDGNMLFSIAAGNDGEMDRQSGNARIQTPSDCVNGFSIGACDSLTPDWKRAPYSSIGPGRSPGIVKPDAVAFGGSKQEPFWVLDAGNSGNALPNMGTSFAAPFALRSAIGVRAHLGPYISPLALKALLIHKSDTLDHDQAEVGWGRVKNSIEDLITCEQGAVHIVYQGELRPAQWWRIKIPFPAQGLEEMVEISATFCFSTQTDPQDPIHYTRSGLEVIFRPDARRRGSVHAKTKPFFQVGELYLDERDLRNDAHKWETTLHRTKKMRGG